MENNRAIVLDEDIEIHKFIMKFLIKNKIEIIKYYNVDFGRVIDMIERAFKMIDVNIFNKQKNVIILNIKATLIYRELIYIFMMNNLEWFNANRMERVSLILAKCYVLPGDSTLSARYHKYTIKQKVEPMQIIA